MLPHRALKQSDIKLLALRWEKGGAYILQVLFTLKHIETISYDIWRKGGYSRNILQCAEKKE